MSGPAGGGRRVAARGRTVARTTGPPQRYDNPQER